MEKLDVTKIGCREFDINGLVQAIGRTVTSMSWGSHKWTAVVKNKVLRFNVQGFHHTGYVYIALNFMDLFDIYITDFDNNIVKKHTDIYIDQLLDVIDRDVEYIPQYK